MANQWLRLWHDMPTDPKWRTISKVSGQRIGDVIAVFTHLLVCASNATERGRTQSFNSEDVASALDLETEQVEAVIQAMQSRVLDGDLLKGWEIRQVAREDGSAERAKAWREAKKAKQLTAANATERKQTPDTDTDTDNKKTPKAPKGASERFEKFWAAYPRKVAKETALKAFEKRNPDAQMLAQMLAAIAVQAKSFEWTKDKGQYIPHPASWLNAGRWTDETTAEKATATTTPAWVKHAGFANVYEANNDRCFEHTAHEFRNGKRIEVAA